MFQLFCNMWLTKEQPNSGGRRCIPYWYFVTYFWKIKFSQTDSRIKIWFFDVSGKNSVPIFRVYWWLGRTKTDEFCCYPSTSTTWRCGRSYFQKRRKTFTFLLGCPPKKLPFNSVATKVSGNTSDQFVQQCMYGTLNISFTRQLWGMNLDF